MRGVSFYSRPNRRGARRLVLPPTSPEAEDRRALSAGPPLGSIPEEAGPLFVLPFTVFAARRVAMAELAAARRSWSIPATGGGCRRFCDSLELIRLFVSWTVPMRFAAACCDLGYAGARTLQFVRKGVETARGDPRNPRSHRRVGACLHLPPSVQWAASAGCETTRTPSLVICRSSSRASAPCATASLRSTRSHAGL